MNGDTIDLVTLRVIVAVADAGSISAGSDQLNLAVAAASTRLSSLEASLGIRIFERSPRGVQVTPTGHMLVQRARELLADADRLTLDLRDYSLGLKGHVRVLANGSSVLELMPQRLERFMRRHPLIRIDLKEHSSPEIAMALLEGRADIGILDLMSPLQGLQLHDFATDTLVLVVPPAHRLAARRRVALEDALEEEFIGLMDGTALSNRLVAEAAALGRHLRIRMQMRSFDAVCRMVAAGLGVGLLPREAVAPQLAVLPLRAIALSDAWAVRTHRLATRSGVELSPAARTLVRALTG